MVSYVAFICQAVVIVLPSSSALRATNRTDPALDRSNPVITQNAPSWFPPLIGGIVTITTALASYYKFGERSRDLYRSAEDMQRDYNWFKPKKGVYKDLNEIEASELLQDRIETFRREEFLRTFAFEEQKESSK